MNTQNDSAEEDDEIMWIDGEGRNIMELITAQQQQRRGAPAQQPDNAQMRKWNPGLPNSL